MIVTDLLEIDITEDQLLITTVNDCRSVTAGEDITDRASPELPEYSWLGSKSNLKTQYHDDKIVEANPWYTFFLSVRVPEEVTMK